MLLVRAPVQLQPEGPVVARAGDLSAVVVGEAVGVRVGAEAAVGDDGQYIAVVVGEFKELMPPRAVCRGELE